MNKRKLWVRSSSLIIKFLKNSEFIIQSYLHLQLREGLTMRKYTTWFALQNEMIINRTFILILPKINIWKRRHISIVIIVGRTWDRTGILYVIIYYEKSKQSLRGIQKSDCNLEVGLQEHPSLQTNSIPVEIRQWSATDDKAPITGHHELWLLDFLANAGYPDEAHRVVQVRWGT